MLHLESYKEHSVATTAIPERVNSEIRLFANACLFVLQRATKFYNKPWWLTIGWKTMRTTDTRGNSSGI